MDLKQLQYFVVSVDSGSFKRAAEVLYTSQPHISKTIKALETELQIELLKRKARGVEVTEAGKKIYEYACRILVESGKIQNVRENINVQTLKVAACSSDRLAELFQCFYMEELKSGLHARYMECSVEEILQAVHRHLAEIGLVCVDQKQITAFRQELQHKHLEFTELGKTEPFLYAGPRSPVYQMPYVTMKELRDLQYVQMRDGDFLSINLIQGNEDYQYHKHHGEILKTNSRFLLLRMILETELCNISYGMFPETAEHEAIRKIPIRGTEAGITFGYVKRKRDTLSLEAERFTDFMKKQLK